MGLRFEAVGLPAGLVIDGRTGVVSGTPTVVAEEAVAVQVVATNASGRSAVRLQIAVSEVKAVVFARADERYIDITGEGGALAVGKNGCNYHAALGGGAPMRAGRHYAESTFICGRETMSTVYFGSKERNGTFARPAIASLGS